MYKGRGNNMHVFKAELGQCGILIGLWLCGPQSFHSPSLTGGSSGCRML